MAKNSLPTYAIVELLIRLEKYDIAIGAYKDHTVYDDEVMVKTSGGSIRFPEHLIIRQFESPELISEDELIKTAQWFKATV